MARKRIEKTAEQLEAERLSKRFVNAVELGFPLDLVEKVSACLDKFGKSTGFRLVTFQAEPNAVPNKSEARLTTKALNACRAMVKKLDHRLVYFPRGIRLAVDVIDDVGVKWFRSQGVSTRTMMDIYGVSAPVLYRYVQDAPTADKRLPQIRNVEAHPEEFAVGLRWVKQVEGANTEAETAKAVEKYSPSRVARMGAALMLFRKHFKREPIRQ